MEEPSLLWELGRMGPVQLRNRLVMPPMQTNFATVHGEVTERMVAYYEERARGGVGLVIVEGTVVEHRLGMHGGTKPWADSDQLIPGLSLLADAIQMHGAAAALQLTQAGGSTTLETTGGLQPVGPSPVRHPHTGIVPRPLSRDEVWSYVDHFASAARRAQSAGFDAVEVHGAHSYLLSAFLSPLTNKREDEFGGSVAGRARFGCEIVRAIRKLCGEGLGILFRISGDEFVEGGRGLEETIQVALLLQEAGIDALHVSSGIGKTPVTVEPSSFEQGWRAYLAAACRQALSVPVITAGVIRYPDVAERILREGKADFVALGRALIADPHWPMKARRGDIAGIRPCISCLAGCIGRTVTGMGSMTCAVNPEVGREWCRSQTAGSNGKGARVVVVGGGPAGMQAAISSARLGCEVHLYEQESRPGGQLWAATGAPHKAKIGWLLEHLRSEVARSGVFLHLGEVMTPSQVAEMPWDVLIVAVGSKSLTPAIPGVQEGNVVSAREVLTEKRPYPGARVVVIGGGMVGCEAALHLARTARSVVVVEQLPDLLRGVEPISRSDILRLLKEAGIRGITGGRVAEIRHGEVIIEQESGGETLETELVVLAVGALASGMEWRKTSAPGRLVSIIGDAAGPRSILEAVREGAMASRLAALVST